MSNDGKVSDLFPRGSSLRNAVKWISEQRTLRPDESLVKLIDEASIRFDLSPQEASFLHQTLRGQA